MPSITVTGTGCLGEMSRRESVRTSIPRHAVSGAVLAVLAFTTLNNAVRAIAQPPAPAAAPAPAASPAPSALAFAIADAGRRDPQQARRGRPPERRVDPRGASGAVRRGRWIPRGVVVVCARRAPRGDLEKAKRYAAETRSLCARSHGARRSSRDRPQPRDGLGGPSRSRPSASSAPRERVGRDLRAPRADADPATSRAPLPAQQAPRPADPAGQFRPRAGGGGSRRTGAAHARVRCAASRCCSSCGPSGAATARLRRRRSPRSGRATRRRGLQVVAVTRYYDVDPHAPRRRGSTACGRRCMPTWAASRS